jgi:ubiquinone/menaquinone biosynthesis C-methylase UbiE
VSVTASFAVGRRLPAISSALRPPALDELGQYGGTGMLRGKRVLDVGTGDGRLALGAAPYAREVEGVDPDADAIRDADAKAREAGLANVRFRVGAAQELPYPDARFEVVIMSWTL